MRKILISLIIVNIFSVLYPKDLWEKYLYRMQRFNPPSVNEKILFEILEQRYGSSPQLRISKDSKETNKNLKQIKKEYLRKGLLAEEGAIRKASLVIIVKNKYKGFSRLLLEQISKTQNITEKKWLIWAFGELGKSEDVLAFVEYLKNEKNPYIMNLLTASISKVAQKDGSITPLMILANNSDNLYVRSTAILGLGKIGDPRAFKTVWDLAIKHPVKEIRFCAVLALSSVTKRDKDLNQKLEILKGRFLISKSTYEKLALAYTIQRLSDFEAGYYMYMTKFLTDKYLKEVAMDLLENLPFYQGKSRLEIVMVNYPQGLMKQRIRSLAMKLGSIRQ